MARPLQPRTMVDLFADIFAVGLIIITLSGVIMLKGNKGIIGRGGIEMIVGIVIPILSSSLNRITDKIKWNKS